MFKHNKWAPVFEAPNDQGASDANAQAIADAAAAKAAADAAALTAAETAAAKAAADAEAAKAAGKTGPSDAEAALIKEQMKTKKALKEANDALAAAQAAVAAFEGLDPAKAKALAAEAKAAEVAALTAAGDFERLKTMMAEQHAKDMAAATEAGKASADALAAAQAQIADLTVGAAFANSKFVADSLVYTPLKTQKVYGEHFAYEDGAVVGYDKPVGKKNATKLVDASGEPLPFEAALTKLIEADPEKDTVLRAKLVSGARSGTVNTKVDPVVKETVRGASRFAAILNAKKA